MTEYAGNSIEEMTSWFITSTCQLLPKSVDHMHDLNLSSRFASETNSILCGSQAEFYIRPLNTCITDSDYLSFKSNELVFSGDYPVLPSDISGLAESIACYKIEPYYWYPGFIKLRVWGQLNYNWKYKKYELSRTAFLNGNLSMNMTTLKTTMFALCRNKFIGNGTLPNIACGPAIKSQTCSIFDMGSDSVVCLVCPQWPTQANNWLRRPRKYGWPTIDTISMVVENGCHVVFVQHRSCREDNRQWRFSFSVAEVILLQSWTQIQQIVYHLLRFFAKRELIQKDCPKEDEVLCPYHLKTLMLWACEEMSPEWWNSYSVIAICCELLKMLSQWIKRRHFPNYFISDANLFYEPSNSTILDKTERLLNGFHKSAILCHWLVENYILPIVHTQLRFLTSLKAEPEFIYYLQPLLEYRKASALKSLDSSVSNRFLLSNQIRRRVIRNGLSSEQPMGLKFGQFTGNLDSQLHSKITFVPTIEKVLCFKYYDFLLNILHTAYGLVFGDISWNNSFCVKLVEAIWMKPIIVRSQYHNFPKTYTEQSSQFQFLCAQDLMQNLTGLTSQPEFHLISLIAREFLRKALEYDDSKPNGIAPAASAYLAALHFATSEYQQAMGCCLEVLSEQKKSSKEDKETLNAGCLLFIDDIARIIGLCVLHKKITENNLNYINRRLYMDLRLSPEFFAYYLTVLLKTEEIFKHSDLGLRKNLPAFTFPIDEYLMALLKPKCVVSIKSSRPTHFNSYKPTVYARTVDNPSIAKDKVIDDLMEIALENMTSFYNVIRYDFGIQCNTADCYRALYLYKCRKYDEVLHFCERMLAEPALQSNLKELAFANILVIPPLDSFFDRDVQSLLGFHTLVHYLLALKDNARKAEVTDDSSIISQSFIEYVLPSNNGLAIFLQFPYSVKRHYFVGRHFLARYLKVKCFIDCNHPYKEAFAEFATQKTSLPFEHIIRRFLIRNVRAAYTLVAGR